MELRDYFYIALKWWWLFLLCTVLGAGAAFLVSSNMTPVYEASTLLMIGGGVDVVNPTTGELQTSEKLAQTYAELLKTRPVLRSVQDTLGLPEKPEVQVALVRSTQLLRITVSDTDAVRAAATADALAEELILQSPSAPQRQEQQYRQFAEQQLTELQAEIDALAAAVEEARDAGLAGTASAYQEEMNTRRATYSSLLGFLSSSATNYIRVVEPAAIPESPTAPKTMQNTLLAAVVGAMLAGGAAFLIEYLDTSIKGREDVEELLGLPVLGYVGALPGNGDGTRTLVTKDLTSPQAEGFRILYTNLRYSIPSGTERRVFMVTSAGPSEGKSVVTANLAAVVALAGKKTVVVDADMRRPRQHRILGHSTETGLSSLLIGEADGVEQLLQSTEVPGLYLLPCGTRPPNPAELLASPRMAEVLDQLCALADVILLDSPPLLAVADPGILAALATGTIMVAEPGSTSIEACAQALDILERADAKPLGMVLNRVQTKGRGGYGYGYGYGYGPYHYAYRYTDDTANGNGHRPSGNWIERTFRTGRRKVREHDDV